MAAHHLQAFHLKSQFCLTRFQMMQTMKSAIESAIGYLRTPFERENGGVGYRCPSEPLKTYEFKKGNVEEAQHSQCLCNALMSNIGLGQLRPDGRRELPLITLGSDLDGPTTLAKLHPKGWRAADVINFLLAH